MHRRPIHHNTYLLKIPGTGRGWRFLLAGLGLAALAAIFLLGSKNLPKLISLYQERKTLAAQIEDVKNTNQRLERQIHDLRVNPQAVEPIAREELGLAAPGELIYRFVPPRTASRSREQNN